MKWINLKGLTNDEKYWRIEGYNRQNIFLWDKIKSLENSGGSPQRYIGGTLLCEKNSPRYTLERALGEEFFSFRTLSKILVED